METQNRRYRHSLFAVGKLYLLGLIIFSVFRLLLFATERHRVDLEVDSLSDVIQSFVMGLRFDLVISGYILFFPVLILLTLDLFKQSNRVVNRVLFGLIFILFTLSFVIAAVDIPYFNQFFTRFSVGAFEWMDSPVFVFKMIAQEPRYLIFMIPLILLVILYYRSLAKILRTQKVWQKTMWFKLPIYLLILGLMFLGIRGRISKKSPIRIGTAYFCENAFLNQLGLNPVFTLMRSYLDSKNSSNHAIELMDDEDAIAAVRTQLNLPPSSLASPIARYVQPEPIPGGKRNVVLVIMESMSAAKMSRHGNSNQLTPFLDSLSQRSLYFEHAYSAGKHTFNGIFSTLFSYPALYRQHPMKQMRRFNGIAEALKYHGYESMYFTTHDAQFDNVEGFLINNDFEHIISQKDYPSEEVKTTLGVPDDYMFRYAIPKLNAMHSKGKPFLSVFMTASDHTPYYIPDYFTPPSKHEKDAIVQYADWSLQQFMKAAKQQPWYHETVFIFVADHGKPIHAIYDISLDYHHTPLIYHLPWREDADTSLQQMSSQIDVFPTLMGLLGLPYMNNSLGIDLLSEERPYVLINDDDKIGVLDTAFLLILKEGQAAKLYNYLSEDRTDIRLQYPEKAKAMEAYARSQMQTFQAILNRSLTHEEFVE